MIWILLEILSQPDGFAVSSKNGELVIRPINELKAEGKRVKG